MSIWHLVIREIKHRKVNFGLGLLSVTVAVGVFIGTLTRLAAHERHTQDIQQEMTTITKQILEENQQATRQATLQLQFNLTVFPRDLDISDFLIKGYSTKYMSESYVHRLASDPRVTAINHLEPSIIEKRRWPERDMEVFVCGIKGEAAGLYLKQKTPFNPRVPQGRVILGYHLHRRYGLKKGDQLTFMQRPFTVHSVHPERGNRDDVTIFMHLEEAQTLLDKQGLITAMRAINCHCAESELDGIPSLIESILPQTRVIMDKPQALARTRARESAAVVKRRTLSAEQIGQKKIADEIRSTAATLVPLIVGACAVWLAFLMYGNVRARRSEIGILRAMGVNSGRVLALFECKAVVIGLAGAALGVAAGVAAGAAGAPTSASGGYWHLVNGPVCLLALGAAPLMAGVASCIPALLAARQDPADILYEE